MTALLAKMPTVHQNAVSYSCASASPVSARRPMIRAAARPEHPPAAGADRPQLAAVIRNVTDSVVHGGNGRDGTRRGQGPARCQPSDIRPGEHMAA